MKIAIACFNLNLLAGGPRLIFSLAQALKKRGNEVVIYAPEFSGEHYHDLWNGLVIKTLPQKEPHTARSEYRVGWFIKKFLYERKQLHIARAIAEMMDADFDVVNLHDFAYRVARFYKAKNPRARIVWTENDPPYMYLPKKNPIASLASRAYNFWKDISSRKDFWAIDSATVLDFYNQQWCKERKIRAVVSRLGVDFESFYQPVRDFTAQAQKKEVRLMALGALNPYRRYEDIIEAVHQLREWGYHAHATIICKDAWDEHAYRQKLINLSVAYGLQPFITFMFRGASERELQEAFRHSQIFIYPVYLPPPRNGFGFSIGALEAIAAGLPLIICRTTTSSEVLKDGETALFVDPQAPNQIAEKVKFLIDHPTQYARIALAGQNFVKREMTWGQYADTLLQSLEQ